MRIALAVTALAAAILGGCRPGGDRPAAGAPGAAAVSGDTALALERTPCFGFCPVYLVVIDSTGHGSIAGQSPTATFRQEVHLSADSLRALLQRIEAAGFFALDTAYIPGHPLCAVPATDHSGAIVTVTLGGRRHQVRHYHGCFIAAHPDSAPTRAPELVKLSEIEDAIDSLAGVGRWVDSLRGR